MKRSSIQKMVVGPILILFFPTLIVRFAIPELILQKSWDFNSASEYAYEPTKIEISSGQAYLKGAAGWYDPAWQYRRLITLEHTDNPSELRDFQIELKLTEANFNFSQARSDGADIRFTRSDGETFVDYWIEAYDRSAETALITIEVPAVPSFGTETLYLYYGNPGVEATSSWGATFNSEATNPSESAPIPVGEGHNAFPALERLANGALLVAFRSGSAHMSDDGLIMLARSEDNGVNWTTSVLFDEPNIDDRVDLGLTLLSDGTLILPFFQEEGAGEVTGAFILRSTDQGETWSEPIAVPAPFPGWIALYGRVIELEDGTILLPAYGRGPGDGFMKSMLLESSDQGGTWSLRSVIVFGSTDYNEASILNLGNGTFLAVVRGSNSPDTLYQVMSFNSGYTWSSPVALGDGVSPDLLMLSNETVLLLSGDRIAPTTGIRAAYSADGGFTWSGGMIIGSGTGDLGYPSTISLPDDSLLTVFYQQDSLAQSRYTEDYIISNQNYHNFFDGLESGSLASWPLIRGSSINISYSEKRSGAAALAFTDTSTSSPTLAVHPTAQAPQQSGSISFWLHPTAIPSGIEFGLLDDLLPWSDPLTDKRFWFRVAPGGALQYRSHRCLQWSDLATQTTLDLGTWTKITLRFNTANQAAVVLVNGVEIGEAGQCSSGSGIEHIAFSSGSAPGTGDAFFLDDLYGGQSTWPYPVLSVGAENAPFPTDNPTVVPLNTQLSAPNLLLGFYETAVKNGGEIKYQLSNDGGSAWRWWDGSQWVVTAGGYEESNTANAINTHIDRFPVGSGAVAFRAFLHSNGTQLVQLDSVRLRYASDGLWPKRFFEL